MKRSKQKVIYQVLALVLGMTILLVGVSLYTHQGKLSKTPIVEHVFTKKVEQHRPTVTKYAKEYDVEEHVDVLLAMMMQESGGRGNDPMQSSESLCGSVGCIDEPKKSIEQGVAYFSKAFHLTDEDIELTIQSYNFGIGFVQYAMEHGDGYNQDIAIAFSKKMYKESDDQSKYTCLREEAKQYDACYGDIYYARDVMAYKSNFAKSQ